MRLESFALQDEQRRPVEALSHDSVEAELVLFLGHLEEEQVGELLDVVAYGRVPVDQQVPEGDDPREIRHMRRTGPGLHARVGSASPTISN